MSLNEILVQPVADIRTAQPLKTIVLIPLSFPQPQLNGNGCNVLCPQRLKNPAVAGTL